MGGRDAVRRNRTQELIDGFGSYLRVFEEQTPFTRAGQWEHHVVTIEMRRRHASSLDAIEDPAFVDSLRDTLKAWGIGVRASKLADRPRFVSELEKQSESLRQLDDVRIGAAEDLHARAVWRLISALDIVDNRARVVALTKTLHHLLPDVVMPVDRAYTGAFLGWHVPEFQTSQQEIFQTAWELATAVSRSVDLDTVVGSGPWHTSVTKVIDNAVVGFCLAEGLVTPAGAGSQQQAGRTNGGDESWTLGELEGELERFRHELTEAGLRPNTIETYVGRAEVFLRWLAGTYQPRGPDDSEPWD